MPEVSPIIEAHDERRRVTDLGKLGRSEQFLLAISKSEKGTGS